MRPMYKCSETNTILGCVNKAVIEIYTVGIYNQYENLHGNIPRYAYIRDFLSYNNETFKEGLESLSLVKFYLLVSLIVDIERV